MSERVDVVVIGAGVVGLAVARALALTGREVLVLEKNEGFGEETSSRNSEVIHAGIYYRTGGLRARLCVAGKPMLYDYCTERQVDHLNCEKLIVAHGPETAAHLEALREKSAANGVHDLVAISGEEAARMEPGLRCDSALLSPSTGIVDSHQLMLALIGDLEQAGGMVVTRAPVVSGAVVDDGLALEIGGASPVALRARLVVNSAGLWSDRVARTIDGLPAGSVPSLYYGKGQYFSYAGAAPFSRLIYPLPGADSLGAHYTRDLAGRARLGPDISYVASNTDYAVDPDRRAFFASSVQSFWPDLDPERLSPGYAGIRPKSAGPGEEGDFIIKGPRDHGVSGYVGLYAMESPALTSCLAIGEFVRALVA